MGGFELAGVGFAAGGFVAVGAGFVVAGAGFVVAEAGFVIAGADFVEAAGFVETIVEDGRLVREVRLDLVIGTGSFKAAI